MPAFAEVIDDGRTVVRSSCSVGVEGNPSPTALDSARTPSEIELEGHEHTVQLLKKEGIDSQSFETEGDDNTQLSALFATDDATTMKLLGLSTVVDVQPNPSSLGKGQGRTPSGMTKVLATIFAAAQHLDSSCADRWIRAVRFGRLDLLEVCANPDSPQTQAVENAGGEGRRTSFWNGYDLPTRRGRERLYLLCSAKRPRHVWFSSPCGSHSSTSGAVSQRVSRIVRHPVSEITGSWLPRSPRAATRCTQLETKFSAWHVQEHAGGHCKRLWLGSS